jgi:ASC-1-like (ASCH) protein
MLALSRRKIMPSKKKSVKRKNTKSNRKKSEELPRLNQRQAKYVEGVMSGKTKMEAAVEAGYSESTALNAAASIEHTDVRKAFQILLRKYAPLEKVAQRIGEGLDAMETKTATFEGHITDTQDFIAWEERRRYAEMAAKMASYYVEKQEIELKKDLNDCTDEELAAILEGRGNIVLGMSTEVGSA